MINLKLENENQIKLALQTILKSDFHECSDLMVNGGIICADLIEFDSDIGLVSAITTETEIITTAIFICPVISDIRFTLENTIFHIYKQA